MSDERFDRDLSDVLREIAGEEAPMSVRYRLSDITERAPIGRQSWFITPMRLSVVVAGLAVLALALLLWPRTDVGPGPNESATPSQSQSQSLEPTPSAEPTPTLVPSAEQPTTAPTVAPTPVPTSAPSPTPAVSSWTGIDWSDPFVPFPHQPGVGWPGIATTIDDVIEWNGEYIGVGAIDDGGSCSEAAFFRSADGLRWEITFRASSGDDRTPTMCPRFVAPLPAGGLVALAQERIWRSEDGITWAELDPSGLRSIWTGRGEEIVGFAAAQAGMVVVGKLMNTYDPIIAFSRDGLTWSNIELPARQEAIAWDVAVWRDRLVIVGRDGQPDQGGSPMEPYTHPGIGAPAAWVSSDGVSWTEVRVEDEAVKAGVLSKVLVGSGGLVGIGNDQGVDIQYEEINDHGVSVWTSSDGLTWSKVGRLDELVPEAWMMESDGTNIVALRADGSVWASADGLMWQPLSAIGEVSVPNFPFLRVSVHEATPLQQWDWRLWVTPTGLVYAGTSEDGWGTKEFQVGVAISP